MPASFFCTPGVAIECLTSYAVALGWAPYMGCMTTCGVQATADACLSAPAIEQSLRIERRVLGYCSRRSGLAGIPGCQVVSLGSRRAKTKVGQLHLVDYILTLDPSRPPGPVD